jgi:Flp pilus assembly protein TadD/glutathione synthase/RimK-type ligase-like ATP-grasp enzyme
VTLSPLATTPSAEDMIDLPMVQHLVLGQEHHSAGRLDEAIACYRSGLDAAEKDAANPLAMATKAELHAKLGNAHMVRGQLDLAGLNYTAALRIAPHLTACWCNLGNVQMQGGNAEGAIAFYLQALKQSPKHWPTRTNLVHALIATGQMAVAKSLLAELAEERPMDSQVQQQLGRVSFELNEIEAALHHFRQATSLNPQDAESLYWLGAIHQELGDLDGAQAAYAAAAEIQPLIFRRAIKSPADFRVLALYAPFAGNTPAEYLFKDAAYDTGTLALFDGSEAELAALRDFDIVVNLISDADQAESVLPVAAHLASWLGKPVINDPDRVRRTTRDAVAELLPDIAGCRLPNILRLAAGMKVEDAVREAQLLFSFPLLARPAGTHGGDDFENIADAAALKAYLAPREGDHYLIEYVDYASRDGRFRKYRFIFVGEKILPYHLAIGSHWKLHHDSTDMADHAWMQQEEAAFLANPGSVFTPAHVETLRAIRARMGLDFFGIDCGFDRDGKLVVFEVNASMLVHEQNEAFPYKDPYVRAIKAAFDEMLAQRAGKRG